MLLKKVIVNTNSEGADLVSSILIDNGCSGTTIVDKSDVVIATNDSKRATELTKFYPTNVLVVGVIEHEDPSPSLKNIEQELKKLSKKNNFGELNIRTEDVNSEHWTDIWQDYYKAYIIGKLKICGTWQKQSRSLFKIPIYLNPGAAFGTGQHPTTELVLMAMQKIDLKNKTILDVGCGSGILGISALKLGAKHAIFLDIDDVAIESTEQNIETNNLKDKSTIIKKDIVYSADPETRGDVILVNITSEIDLDFAKNINNNINPNGVVILSGILQKFGNEVKNAYIKAGFSMISELTLGDWTTYVMRKI